jgi:NADH-quinone oxidoreductase subunit H
VGGHSLQPLAIVEASAAFGFFNGFGFNPLLFPMAVMFLISAWPKPRARRST